MEYGWFSWIIIGLIAGALAKWIMPGKDPGGLIVTILVGIVGGVVGGWLANTLPFIPGTGGLLWDIILATAGAALLLFLYRKIRK